MDVPLDASPADVNEVAENWIEQYRLHRADYEPGFFAKLWNIVSRHAIRPHGRAAGDVSFRHTPR